MNETQGDIERHRARIDEIDAELVRLWNARAEEALAIGAIKAAAGIEVYNPQREGRVIALATERNEGPLTTGAIQELVTATIAACRELEAEHQ
jgi:chorismate mutase